MALWLSFDHGDEQHPDDTPGGKDRAFSTPLLHPAGWDENVTGATTVDLSIEPASRDGRAATSWEEPVFWGSWSHPGSPT